MVTLVSGHLHWPGPKGDDNTLPNGLVFKQLPQDDQQMFMHEKTCVIVIFEYKKAQKDPKVSHLIFIALSKDQIMKLCM